MSMNPVSFESSWKKAKEREVLKEARQRMLAKAEANAERRMQRERLEASWMLPSLEDSLKESKKRKKKKEKKSKKEKKVKKEKKKKSKKRRSKSSSSSSDESDEWVEKTNEGHKEDERDDNSDQESGKFQNLQERNAQRQSWMLTDTTDHDQKTETPNFDFLASEDSRVRGKERRAEERRHLEQQKAKMAAQRELNPDLRERENGDESKEKSSILDRSSSSSSSLSSEWLRRALRRAHEQAEREQRSVEEVAAERWGSLQKLQSLLHKANEEESKRRGALNSSRRSNEDRYSGHRSVDRGQSRGSWRRYGERDHHRQRGHEERRRSRSPQTRRTETTTPTVTRKREEPRKKNRRSSSSSSSSSSEHKEVVNEKTEQSTEQSELTAETSLTESEMNALGAKIVKAELMGNDALAQKLKLRLEQARKSRPAEEAANKNVVEEVRATSKEPEIRLKKSSSKTRVSSQASSASSSLRSMFVSERDSAMTNADLTLATKYKLTDENNLDDNFDSIDNNSRTNERREERYREQEAKAVLRQEKLQNQAMNDCKRCLSSHSRHLLIAIGEKCSLSVPHHESLTSHHCLITPNDHVKSLVEADEDMYEEVMRFRSALTSLFNARDQDCIFFETVTHLNRFPHTQLQCVPIDRAHLLLHPSAYFQKAIDECEMEWSHNRKLIKIDPKKGLRRSVPKKLPYFFVGCGNTDLFAHVIEDERSFPSNFAQEIIGGMLDLDPHLWRRPQREAFETQKRKVIDLAQLWADVDFTKRNH